MQFTACRISAAAFVLAGCVRGAVGEDVLRNTIDASDGRLVQVDQSVAVDSLLDSETLDTTGVDALFDAHSEETRETSAENDVDPPSDHTAVGSEGPATDAGAEAASLPACDAGLQGTTPFAVKVQGSAGYTPTMWRTGPSRTNLRIATVYFPNGRVAGAPFHVSYQGFPWRGSVTFSGVVLFDGSSDVLRPDVSQDPWATMQFRLLSGGGGLFLEEQLVVFESADVLNRWEGSMILCEAGPPPTPQITLETMTIAPTSRLRISSSVPLLGLTPERFQLRAGAQVIPLVLRRAAASWELLPTPALPPGQPIELSLSGLQDPIGRTFSEPVRSDVLRTTTTVTDGTFSSSPPMGSIVPVGAYLSSAGAITLNEWTESTLVALGTPPPDARGLRLRGGWSNCLLPRAAALVNAEGLSTSIPELCTATGEAFLALPGPGPLWLSFSFFPTETPFRLGPSHATFTLDSAIFE